MYLNVSLYSLIFVQCLAVELIFQYQIIYGMCFFHHCLGSFHILIPFNDLIYLLIFVYYPPICFCFLLSTTTSCVYISSLQNHPQHRIKCCWIDRYFHSVFYIHIYCRQCLMMKLEMIFSIRIQCSTEKYHSWRFIKSICVFCSHSPYHHQQQCQLNVFQK